MILPRGMPPGVAPEAQRTGSGREAADQDPPYLELYQVEGCGYCDDVRQTLDDLGLDYVVRTEPPDHGRRERVRALSGQTLVPVLVDHAHDAVLHESRVIIAHLRKHHPIERS